MASAEVSWQTKDRPRDYRWTKARIEVKQPFDSVEITALGVERTAIGDVPEYPLNTILVDAIEITDRLDLVHYIGPGWRSSLLLTPEEVKKLELERRGGPAPEAGKAQKLSIGPEVKGNRVRCGGFESGAQPHWFVWKQETTGYWLTESFFSTENPVEGKYCLRLPGSTDLYNKTGKWRFSVSLSSEPLKLRSHGRYTFSFYVRADDPAVSLRAGVVLGPRGARPRILRWYCALAPRLSTEWQRFSVSFDFHDEINKPQVYFLASRFSGEPDENYLSKGAVYLDAVQVEEGDLTDYSPATPVEVALFSDCFRLYYYPEPLKFHLRAVRYDERRSITLLYEIRDLAMKVVSKGRRVVKFGGKRTVDSELELELGRRGAYLLAYRIKGVEGSEGSLDIAIIDPPRKDATTFLGIYSAFSPMNMSFYRRAEARYYLTLCDGKMFRGYSIAGPGPKERVPDKVALELVRKNQYVWWDEIIQKIQGYGLQVIPEFLNYEMPRWVGARQGASVPVWTAHIRKVVSHYARNPRLKLDRWITGDEVRKSYDVYHKSALETIKSIIPNATVMLSTAGGAIDHFIEKFGSPVMDACGGSWINQTKWEYLNFRRTIDKYRIPFWNIGVGWGSRPIDGGEEAIGYNIRRGRFSPVTNLLYWQAILQPQIWCTYTNRYTSGIAYGTNDYRTGTFVPHGVYFVATVAFLQDAKRGDEIPLKYASGLDAFYFLKGGSVWAVLSPSRTYSRHAPIEEGFKLTLDLDPKKVNLYDIDLSPLRIARRKAPIRYLLEPQQILLIEGVDVPKEPLLKAVGEVRAERYHYAVHYFTPNPETGGLDLVIQVFDSEAKSGEATVSLSGPLPLAEGAKRTVTTTFKWGRLKPVRFALDPVLGTSRPIGNLIASYTVAVNGTVLFRNSARLWWLVSKKSEQTKLSSENLGGYLFATQRYGGSYHTLQVRRGGQRYLFKDELEVSARIYSNWDREKLRIAVDVVDDSFVVDKDRILLYLDTGLLGDIGGGEFNRDDFEITLLPELHAGTCSGIITSLRGHSGTQAISDEDEGRLSRSSRNTVEVARHKSREEFSAWLQRCSLRL